MLILTIRTDKPEAELGIFKDGTQLAYSTWTAHRQLAETIHLKIKELMESQGHALNDLGGIVVFKGPGSFTGLRIGISVANALAYSLGIPVIGANSDDWINKSIKSFRGEPNKQFALPEYGLPPHITPPKK
jgi:tRNA threonylcarbamoyladenosine biosynthesis protein TsaB